MFVNVKNDDGHINSTVFIRYEVGESNWDEYTLVWNHNYNLDDKDDEFNTNLPIKVISTNAGKRGERYKRLINPLQIKLELLKEHSQNKPTRPFLAIKSNIDNKDIVESIWIGVLDLDK